MLQLVGPILARDPRPLPADLQSVLDEAQQSGHGAIYVSMVSSSFVLLALTGMCGACQHGLPTQLTCVHARYEICPGVPGLTAHKRAWPGMPAR